MTLLSKIMRKQEPEPVSRTGSVFTFTITGRFITERREQSAHRLGFLLVGTARGHCNEMIMKTKMNDAYNSARSMRGARGLD
jgi:hypothetical protein